MQQGVSRLPREEKEAISATLFNHRQVKMNLHLSNYLSILYSQTPRQVYVLQIALLTSSFWSPLYP